MEGLPDSHSILALELLRLSTFSPTTLPLDPVSTFSSDIKFLSLEEGTLLPLFLHPSVLNPSPFVLNGLYGPGDLTTEVRTHEGDRRASSDIRLASAAGVLRPPEGPDDAPTRPQGHVRP